MCRKKDTHLKSVEKMGTNLNFFEKKTTQRNVKH